MSRFLRKTLGKQYEVESHLFNLLFSSVFKATDITTGRSVAVIIGMSPFINDPEVHESFLERLNLAATLNHVVYPVIKFGIDSAGYPFAIVPGLDGIKLTERIRDYAEAERRFAILLKTLAGFHKQRFSFGDLCENSFLLERSGGVRIVGSLGDFRRFVQDPELKDEDLFSVFKPRFDNHFKADVAAVGLLLCKFFTGTYPQGSELNLDTLKLPPPSWFVALTPAMLEGKFNDLTEVQREYEGLKSAPTGLHEVKKVNRGVVAQQQQSVMTVGPQLKTTSTRVSKMPGQSKHQSKMIITLGGLSLALIPLFLALIYVLDMLSPKLPDVSVARNDISSGREDALRKLANSDDPVAFQTLIELLRDSKDLEEFKKVHYTLLQRAIRQGFSVSAELVRRWALNFFDKGERMPVLEVYHLFDVSLPLQNVLSAIEQVQMVDARAAKLLLIGIILDKKDKQFERDALNSFFKSDVTLVDAVINDPDLLMEFRELVTDYSSLDTQRLYQVLDNLVTWGFEDQISKITAALNEREIKHQEKIVLHLFSLPTPSSVRLYLARLLSGKVQLELLTNWRDPALSDVALASALFTDDQTIREKLWALLNQAPVSDKSLSESIKIIRSKFQDQRIQLLDLLALIRFSEFYPTSEGVSILRDKASYIRKDKDLLRIVFSLSNDSLVSSAFKIFRQQLTVAQLLQFLNHPSKEVRLSAVESLIGVKELGAMKIILDSYNKEKDAEIRRIYEDNFWFIRERVRQ